MPSDPKGWPDEAYEAVAKAIHIRRYMVPMFSDDARYCAALADAALTALAPFVAAREQAAAVAMREAIAKHEDDAAMAWRRVDPNLFEDGLEDLIAGHEQRAAAIRALPLRTDALTAMLAQARREALEEAAQIAATADKDEDRVDRIMRYRIASHIRAKAQEVGDE